MSSHPSPSSATSLSVALVADSDCFALFGPVIRHLCVGLLDEAVRVSLISDQVAIPASFPAGPVAVVGYRPPGWRGRGRTVRRICEEFGRDTPMVVHALCGRVLELARQLGAHWDVPVAVTLTGLEEVSIEQTAGDDRSYWVAPTEPILQHLRQALQVPAERCKLIRPGLHAQAGPGCFQDDSKTGTILAAGMRRRGGGLDRLIRAMRALRDQGCQAMLFVLDGGPDERALRRLTEQLALTAVVTFVGQLPAPAAAMRGADLFVLPRPETSLTSLPLEALGAGMATVAAAGSVLDFLIDGRTALLFEPDDESDLARQLRRLLTDRDYARRLALAGREHIRQFHSVSAMVTAVRGLYEQLALPQRTLRFESRPD